MKLYYKTKDEVEFIGDFKTKEDALKEIYGFWESLGHSIPYVRVRCLKNGYMFDVGFHTRFYNLIKDDEGMKSSDKTNFDDLEKHYLYDLPEEKESDIKCCICEYNIYEGDLYYEVNDEVYCEDCAREEFGKYA